MRRLMIGTRGAPKGQKRWRRRLRACSVKRVEYVPHTFRAGCLVRCGGRIKALLPTPNPWNHMVGGAQGVCDGNIAILPLLKV
jgi:hypothetical protein